jgi:hypothetical protein
MSRDDYSGKDRQQWGCSGKWIFPTWSEALRTAKRLNRRSQQRVRPYVCQFCGRVHLGGHRHEEKRRRSEDAWEDE